MGLHFCQFEVHLLLGRCQDVFDFNRRLLLDAFDFRLGLGRDVLLKVGVDGCRVCDGLFCIDLDLGCRRGTGCRDIRVHLLLQILQLQIKPLAERFRFDCEGLVEGMDFLAKSGIEFLRTGLRLLLEFCRLVGHLRVERVLQCLLRRVDAGIHADRYVPRQPRIEFGLALLPDVSERPRRGGVRHDQHAQDRHQPV